MRLSDSYTSQSTLVPILCAFALGLFGLHLYKYISKFFNTCPPPQQEKTESVENVEVLFFEDDRPESVQVYKLAHGLIKIEIKNDDGLQHIIRLDTSTEPEHRKRRIRPPHRFRNPHHPFHWKHRFPHHRHGRKHFMFKRDLESCLAISYPPHNLHSMLLEHDARTSALHQCPQLVQRHFDTTFESRFDRERPLYLDSDAFHHLRDADLQSWTIEHRSILDQRRTNDAQEARIRIKRLAPHDNQ